jgi:hypothetical protein
MALFLSRQYDAKNYPVCVGSPKDAKASTVYRDMPIYLPWQPWAAQYKWEPSYLVILLQDETASTVHRNLCIIYHSLSSVVIEIGLSRNLAYVLEP